MTLMGLTIAAAAGARQVNFVPVGTLRDLVTYPMSKEEVRRAGRADAEILECLRCVGRDALISYYIILYYLSYYIILYCFILYGICYRGRAGPAGPLRSWSAAVRVVWGVGGRERVGDERARARARERERARGGKIRDGGREREGEDNCRTL
jgi:hypothetical protein